MSEGWRLPVGADGTRGVGPPPLRKPTRSPPPAGPPDLGDPLQARTAVLEGWDVGAAAVQRCPALGDLTPSPITKPGGSETRKLFIAKVQKHTAEMYSNKLGGGREGARARGPRRDGGARAQGRHGISSIIYTMIKAAQK